MWLKGDSFAINLDETAAIALQLLEGKCTLRVQMKNGTHTLYAWDTTPTEARAAIDDAIRLQNTQRCT